jgi:hypothetical protein
VTAGQSILRQLCPAPCDPSELEQVLLRRYSSSGGDRNNTRALLFPGNQEQYSVRLVFDKKYALKDAEAGPRLSDPDLSELNDLIKREILTPGPPRVATWTLFAALPVSGCFRTTISRSCLFPKMHRDQSSYWPIIHSFCNSDSREAPMGWLSKRDGIGADWSLNSSSPGLWQTTFGVIGPRCIDG